MGYDFHITRAEFWPEAESNPITLKEWLAYVQSDSELEFAGCEKHEADSLEGSDEVDAVWVGHSGYEASGMEPPLWWSGGEITTKHADQETRVKMWRIAQHFGARLVGDEDEEYGADGEPVEEFIPPAAHLRAAKKPWWKKLLGG